MRRQLLTVDLPDPDPGTGAELWQAALGSDIEQGLGPLLEQFRFGPHGVHEAAAQARVLAELRGGADAEPTMGDLWTACRAHAGHDLGGLAHHLSGSADWDQLVLPDEAVAQLREIVAQVRNRGTVYGEWGWERRLGRGRGISALFSGPPGTGKTMAAEILADSLDLDLYRIDLSQVVSKYIGETEKNLARLFDAAERGGAILLFDEADALFGKRTEVKDSHDRYANIEINYLLQRMEDYRGLAILASNRKADLDDAFMRRIRFVVTFPFPDPASRLKIWQVILPAGVPTNDLDPRVLARLDIAGGNIKNVALNASFLAADEGVPVGMDHVMQSARQEYQKIEKLVSRSEFGEYSRSGT
jgi:SpoVK/Ycf46/Vps4 family AAA+-type ATPase